MTLRSRFFAMTYDRQIAKVDKATIAKRVEEALLLFDESLKVRKARLGPDHPITLAGMSNLALAYKSTGKPDQALPLFESTHTDPP